MSWILWLVVLEIALIAGAVAALSDGPQVGDLTLRQGHHAWLGLAVFVLSLLLYFWVSWFAGGMVLGCVITADDTYQHMRQRWGHDPEYRSWLHRALGLVWQWRWVQRLAGWFNDVCGGGTTAP